MSQTVTVPSGFTGTQTYTYDALNRLKSATEMIVGSPSWKQTFLYDRYGNRNFDTANTTTLGSCAANQCNPTVNATNNRFTSGQGYTYDLAGNIITDAQGRTFTYDGENKQKEVKDVNNISVGQYFYDGDGKRVKKFIFNTQETTRFVYDAGGQLIEEYGNQTGQPPTTSYVYASGRMLTVETATLTSYLTHDHLGSPRITTDGSGAVISRRDFLPFGEEVLTAQRTSGLNYTADNIRQKFTSYERDNESSLDFAQARYFNSVLGRFTSPDSFANDTSAMSPQSWNLYVYVRNNPLFYVDRNGKKIVISFYELNSKGESVQRSLIYTDKNTLVDINGNQYVGNNAVANAALDFLNRLSVGEGGDAAQVATQTLRDAPETHTFEIGEGNNPGSNPREALSSTVTFDLTNDSTRNESFVGLGTALVGQNLLQTNPNAVYPINPVNGEVQTGEFYSDNGGTATLTPLEEALIKGEYSIRKAAGITQITNARGASVPLENVCGPFGVYCVKDTPLPPGPETDPSKRFPVRKGNATDENKKPGEDRRFR